MSTNADRIIERLGTTYAEEAGITLRDKPSSLWQLLVLSLLLSARIDGDIAVRSTRELNREDLRTPARMRESTWQQRVDALGRGGYRRFDERTSTQLAEAAHLLLERWKGDLRKLHAESDGDQDRLLVLLQSFNGIGPAGAEIFVREVQAVWPDMRPFIDDLTRTGAKTLGLPTSPNRLYAEVRQEKFHQLVAACVRAARDPTGAN